jgi:anhydro-N-acetylmuramic acid kinase
MALARAIGLMSGTSMDGIDLAFIETDGEAFVRMGPSTSLSYEDADRALLREAVEAARSLTDRRDRPGKLAAAEQRVTACHAALVTHFMRVERLGVRDVDVVGFHGQTVLHRPEAGLTVQIGDGPALAAAIGIPVVHDLRAADMAAGGQGAPFVPVYHRALVADADLGSPVAILNLGGVGNITYIEAGRDPIAFDTGPGNALLDDLILERTGAPMDRDGLIAAAGTVNETALSVLLDHRYFRAPPPKSLDRDAFRRDAVSGLSVEDAAATLVAFTATAVAIGLDWLPHPPASIVVCGGGARNPAMLRSLAQRIVVAKVSTADEVGWTSDMMEAQAFAYLAVRSLKGLPLSFPTTTGVPAPMTGGVLARPPELGYPG